MYSYALYQPVSTKLCGMTSLVCDAISVDGGGNQYTCSVLSSVLSSVQFSFHTPTRENGRARGNETDAGAVCVINIKCVTRNVIVEIRSDGSVTNRIVP